MAGFSVQLDYHTRSLYSLVRCGGPHTHVAMYMYYIYFITDHIDHIKKVAGIDYVGLGSDYDGVPS